jgi:tRNA(adenine34) deaminase
MTDAEALARCDALAQVAASRDESPVGSIVVVGDLVIGEGVEASKARRDVTCHAEVEAIRAAAATHGRDLAAATLYTTHEPCLLCSYVIRHHRMARVVIRYAVPDVGGATSRLPVLTTRDVASWGPPPLITWIT